MKSRKARLKEAIMKRKRTHALVQEAVWDVNEEIAEYSDGGDSPIWLQSRNVAKVRAEGFKKPVKITRKMARRGGAVSMGSGFGQLGPIVGDWRPITYIKEDVEGAFSMLDKKLKEKGVDL
jgi:hypothetical protein